MKQLILVFILLFLGEITYSQIITANSRPIAGDVFQYKTDTITIDTSTFGMNVTWDFSSLNLPDSIYSANYVAPSSTGLASYFSNSNYAVGSWGLYFYLGTNQYIEEKGFSNIPGCPLPYTNPLKIMKFPFTYGDTLNDNYNYFNDCTMDVFGGNGTIHVKGDGMGTLILPAATYSNILRVKTVLYATNFDGENSKTVKYEWYQSGKKFPLISFYSIQGMPPNSTNVYFKKLTLWENEYFLNDNNQLAEVPLILFPNPATSNFNFKNNEKYTKLALLDMAGRTIAQYEIQINQINCNIDISGIENGIYLLQLSNNKLLTNQRLVIKR